MSYTRDRESFIARIINEAAPTSPEDFASRPSWSQRADLARTILRNAATHHRLAELDCNGGLTPKQARQSDACEQRIRAALADLGPGFGVGEFSGDPRGATVKITLPSGYGDSWGDRSHYCVPVRG